MEETTIQPPLEGGVPPSPEPKKPFWRKIPGFRSGKPWKIVLASAIYGIIILFIVAVNSSGDPKQQAKDKSSTSASTATAPSKQTIPQTPPETPEQFKESCQKILFDDLARDTEKYSGKRFTCTGEVIQVLEQGNNVSMRVNITQKGSGNYKYWSDTILVNYIKTTDESRILEKDVIQLWGSVIGRKSYKAVMGQEITLPEVAAKYVTVVQKRPAQ